MYVCEYVGVCGDDQVSAAWLELILVLALLPSQPQPPLDNLPCGRETYTCIRKCYDGLSLLPVAVVNLILFIVNENSISSHCLLFIFSTITYMFLRINIYFIFLRHILLT